MSIDARGTWIDTHPHLTPAQLRRAASTMAAAAIRTGHTDDIRAVLTALGLADDMPVMACGHPTHATTRDTSGHGPRCTMCRPTRQTLNAAPVPCQAPTPGTEAGARWHWRRKESCPSCTEAAARARATRVARQAVTA